MCIRDSAGPETNPATSPGPERDPASGPQVEGSPDAAAEAALWQILREDPNDVAAFHRLADVVRRHAADRHVDSPGVDRQRAMDDAVWSLAEELAHSGKAWYPLVELARLSLHDDRDAACAGFCYALALATDMVRGGSARHVLVVGVEKLSDFTDPEDRGSAFIFADGAGAVVVGPSRTAAIGPTVWGSDGAQWDAIVNKSSWIAYRDSDHEEWPWLTMAGHAVFRWAVWQMSPVAQKALDAAGVAAADLDSFIPHQANMRIIDAMVKQLQLPGHVAVARDIAHSGNTSAASIPLAMDRMLTEGEAHSGGLALLIGFGAGLAYASQVVELP